MSRVQRALLSVTDKAGVVDFAKRLAALRVELVSTGGTAKLLREAGIAVRDISDLTGFPEMLDGRVKTLHPKVHGGILHVRSNPEHVKSVGMHGIAPIDMVVVNLYAFEKTAAKPGVTLEELIENIDIGGPSMIRSAAKNWHDVVVVTSPADYGAIADEMEQSGGEVARATRWRLAQKAFATTADYDSAIASTLEQISDVQTEHAPSLEPDGFPPTLRLRFGKVTDLRYGENPHQKAALYSDGSSIGVANGRQLQGKELSFNNIVDLQAAWDLAAEFAHPFCAIIKHTNPCGAAVGTDLPDAFRRAFECDPLSAFGGVIALNGPVNGATAEAIAGLRHNGTPLFIECIAAPHFDDAARERFAKRKDLRLVAVNAGQFTDRGRNWTLKYVSGGMLVQDVDFAPLTPADLKTVTERWPTEEQIADLLFAWRICKHVKSNAIVYARDGQTVGVGAGQMSRVDSTRLGVMKAVLPLAGTVAASDAFFPFPDGVEEIAKAGAVAIIQPGGSVRDQEVIDAANRLGLAMVFTGIRHFRH